MEQICRNTHSSFVFLLFFNIALDYDDRNVLQKLCLNRTETQKVCFTAVMIHIRLKQHYWNELHNDHCSRRNKVTTCSIFYLNFERHQKTRSRRKRNCDRILTSAKWQSVAWRYEPHLCTKSNNTPWMCRASMFPFPRLTVCSLSLCGWRDSTGAQLSSKNIARQARRYLQSKCLFAL